jgi:Transposase DDE domain group 1
MKTSQSSGTSPDHQTVASSLEFKAGQKSIAISFTDQKLSPHAGSATFWAWLHPRGWIQTLAQALPHPLPTSNNHLLPLEKALAFMQGLLCAARKLTHVAYLRRDPLVPELLGIQRIASQSALSRFFAGFDSAGANLRCFRPLWRWCLERLPSGRDGGYTLDLDSTKLLHKDGHQQGVKGGYTKQGIKPCLHPLLASLAEVRLVVSLWLRPGNASCGNNAAAFFQDLLANLPAHVRLKGVRADAGFCLPELLALWEQLQLPYVVVAQLSRPIQKILKGGLAWSATEVPGTEVAQMEYQAMSWPQARRLILVRHRVSDEETRGGKKLLDVPGWRFQALLTSWPSATHTPLQVWRYYNGRADCENVIKELQEGFALPTLCLEKFWATEAALSLAALTYNLAVLFQRHLGWQQKVTISNLRYWLFVTAGVLSHPGGKTTIKLAAPERERAWWRRLWNKISSPFPNCNAVENRPAFTG